MSVPADAAYDAATNTLNVTTISAQNDVLDGHSPDYAIGTGGNSPLFNMTGSTLMFITTPVCRRLRRQRDCHRETSLAPTTTACWTWS